MTLMAYIFILKYLSYLLYINNQRGTMLFLIYTLDLCSYKGQIIIFNIF